MKKVLVIGAGCTALHEAVISRLGGIQFSKRIDPTELGQPGFEVRYPDASLNGFDLSAVIIDEVEQKSTPEEEKRKEAILTDLYKTGRLEGLYFGRSSRSEANPIKHYIKSCLYKRRIAQDEMIIEDCYNEMFEHLCKKTAHKICTIYDESPKKLIATALKIIALKCFAVDPRYNNPRHSFIESYLHKSARHPDAICIIGSEISHEETEYTGEGEKFKKESGGFVFNYNKGLIKDESQEPSDFFKAYGFEIEDLIERLNPQQRADFYECIGKQRRGKVSAPLQAKRDELFEVIKQIKDQLKN